MADAYLLENGTDRYLLEDGSGVLLLDVIEPGMLVGADATGTPHSGHLFYAVNSARWWFIYVRPATPTILRSAWSTDLLAWTDDATATLAQSVGKGTDLVAAYRNIAATDVLHVGYSVKLSNTDRRHYHLRATISGSTLTWAADAQISFTATGSYAPDAPDGPSLAYDSADKLWTHSGFAVSSGSGSVAGAWHEQSTNADAGTSWTAGWGTPAQDEAIAASVASRSMLDLGATTMLSLWDDGATDTNLNDVRWSKFSGTWGAPANVFASVISIVKQDWGACLRTTTDVHAVRRTAATTYEHRRFNGTSWSAGASIPTQASKAGAGVFLSSDGTDVWCFVIDSAAGNAIRSCKWSSGTGTWGAWTDVETSSQVRTALSGHRTAVAGGIIGLAWTEVDGASFKVVTKPFTTGLPSLVTPQRLVA